ncbi:hypothetical protein ANN_22234 [Periplaneta americana]|uniref:Uncharacterized protein n=1 Tax=Periplaneta americana TaxID=6978 RepID=A0ABQ8S8B7_PERAM|nr:hypothetical protein ANN_22234 [Periplaneta americana]
MHIDVISVLFRSRFIVNEPLPVTDISENIHHFNGALRTINQVFTTTKTQKHTRWLLSRNNGWSTINRERKRRVRQRRNC